MKTLEIKAIETDLRSAIEKSEHAYGLTTYASYELTRKEKLLENVKEFYLVPSQSKENEMTIFYVHSFKGKNGIYRTLKEFSWIGCLHNGAAALCNISSNNPWKLKIANGIEKREKVEVGDVIVFGVYQYDRDQLRGDNRFWTIS